MENTNKFLFKNWIRIKNYFNKIKKIFYKNKTKDYLILNKIIRF